MRYSTAKRLFLFCIIGGLCLLFIPMFYGIAVYDEPIFNFVTYIGFGVFISGYIFDRVLSRCPACKKSIRAGFGGLLYVINRARTKECPHCSVELK
ncbi:MAG: hypothetical protein FWC71_03175 [Defluviitaleaceae bacterium]|nr:hypothetical protein [Defluviitaleaceae bacterium]